MRKNKPQYYNLPHEEWREHQWETINWLLEGGNKINVVHAPVGSGKTAAAAALGANGRSVTSVTINLALQKQYEEYGFVPLSGMANYQCMFNPLLTTDMCSFAPMHECPLYKECLYILQKEKFKYAVRGSLNYHYFLHAEWLKEMPKSWIVFDEAHEIRRLLIDHLTIRFTNKDCYEYDIPPWHKREIKADGIRLMHALKWLRKGLDKLGEKISKLKPLREGNPSINRKINRLKQMASKFTDITLGISRDPGRWYAYFDEDQIRISPLSVAEYFHSFFTNGYPSQFLLMSGTIGNHESFTNALGIGDYAFRAVPSRFPPETRPVYDLKAPRMSYGAGPLAYEKQADIIADAIKTVPWDWSGILHVNSKAKANGLAERLARRGLQDRVFLIKGRGTGNKLLNWRNRKAEYPNSLGISYSFGQGVDLFQERINISCDVPFKSLGDPVERARADYDSEIYHFEAALGVEQRNGRTRRGRPQDYDDGYDVAGLNGIADSNYKIVQSHFSQDFAACITSW